MEKNIRSAIDVSRYIINKCHDEGINISNLKLQKLLYFAQGFSLVTLNKPLFFEEIEAWDFGPVVPEVYREYKMYGANEIPRIDSYYNINYSCDDFLEQIEFNNAIFTENEKKIMDMVVENLGIYSANYLVTLTHKQLPWLDTFKNEIISKEKIKEYFKNLFKELN